MTIYILKTTTGREDIVLELLETKVKIEAYDIKCILHPAELKGYIFLEGNIVDIHKATQGMLHIKGLLEKPVQLSDIQRFLEDKKISVDVGDIVEIIGGAFKGEKGKINRIDKTKDEITLELLEASMPIPVTISTEFVKLVSKAKKDQA